MPDSTHSFNCISCGELLPAYIANTRCPNCKVELGPIGSTDLDETGKFDDSSTIQPSGKFATDVAGTQTSFGDYELLNEIARGGMGVVYQARQISLNRTVALKMILDGQLASELEIDRFRIEAQAAANLDHPYIVPVYDHGQINGKHFFSMALIEGQSLKEKISDEPMRDRDAASLMQKIAAAIDYAHQRRIVHRDLKPDNILLDKSGNPRITDFGLAKNIDARNEVTVSGQTLGTPSYMSPEQATGESNIGPAADIYSLGAVLYAMLTGRPPFQGDNLLSVLSQVIEREPIPVRQFIPNASIDLETICLKCLEKDPAERYTTAAELVDELNRFLVDEPIHARPLTGWQKIKRWRRIVARNKDVRLRSATEFMGWPLVDIAFGYDTEAGETAGHAKGVIAMGDRATGLIASGTYPVGLFAYGLVARGLVAFGLCGIGPISFGLVSIGILSFGGLSIGYASLGFISIGVYALGTFAIGYKAIGMFAWSWIRGGR